MTDSAAATTAFSPAGAAAAAAPTGWQRLRQNKLAMVSLGFLAAMFFACFFIPPFLHEARSEPSRNNFIGVGQQGAPVPYQEEIDGKKIEKTATFTYYWGADANGRDLFRRCLEGGRVSLIIGLCAASISLFLGTFIGLTAGYLGGRVDAILMRAVDVLYSIPRLLFILVFTAALNEPFQTMLGKWLTHAKETDSRLLAEWLSASIDYSRILLMIVCLGLIEWLTMARIVRGQVLVLREQQFVAAARALGRGPWAIMRKHLLPNLWTVILTYLTLTVPIVIIDESFLSFLGVGVQDPATSWGVLLKDGAGALNPIVNRWWLLIFPATLMGLTLLALNFLGDGLRDAFDVK